MGGMSDILFVQGNLNQGKVREFWKLMSVATMLKPGQGEKKELLLHFVSPLKQQLVWFYFLSHFTRFRQSQTDLVKPQITASWPVIWPCSHNRYASHSCTCTNFPFGIGSSQLDYLTHYASYKSQTQSDRWIKVCRLF